MRIAFGVDGVLADVEKGLSDLAGKVFDRNLQDLSPDDLRLLVRVVRASDGFWQHLEEIEPGAVAQLAAIARERAWEVIFLVRRMATEGFTAQVQTQQWLADRGFPLPSVYVVNGSLDPMVRALDLDVVVDSPFDDLTDAVNHARAASTGNGHEATTVVGSVEECLQGICKVDSGPRQRLKNFTRRMSESAADLVFAS